MNSFWFTAHVFIYCWLFFFKKLMWMLLTYAWVDSFWWSVKEMEIFI